MANIALKLTQAQARIHQQSLTAIAWMSFFWSSSSLMVFSVLPTFLTDVLGASYTKVGLIEGIAISASFASKLFSGILCDKWRSRKPLILIGTLFTVALKPVFAVAASIQWIFGARLVDRLSKGLRAAPTDALITDLSEEVHRGKSFGLRQALYTLGAVFGALIATYLMFKTGNDYRFIFWCSTVVAGASLVILLFYVHPSQHTSEQSAPHWHWREIKELPAAYWQVVLITTTLMVARFSEMFLNLRAKEVGWSVAALPLLVVAMDIVHAGVAYPMGKRSDKINRTRMLLEGIFILVIADIVMVTIPNFYGSLIGILLIGLHMGITQGLIKAMVAESIPFHLRGTAFGIFYLTSGFAILFGNTVSGTLADRYGLFAPFLFGGAFAMLSCYLILRLKLSEKKAVA